MNEKKEYAGVARVGVRFVRNGREEDVRETEEVVAIAHFGDAKPAYVTRGYGLTMNLGNYESARFDVSVSMPCLPEDVDMCDEWAKNWVSDRVTTEATEVRSNKSGGGGAKVPERTW